MAGAVDVKVARLDVKVVAMASQLWWVVMQVRCVVVGRKTPTVTVGTMESMATTMMSTVMPAMVATVMESAAVLSLGFASESECEQGGEYDGGSDFLCDRQHDWVLRALL